MTSTYLSRRPLPLRLLLIVFACSALVACTGSDDSPVQADGDLLDDSPVITGEGDEDLTAEDAGLQVTPTVIQAELGEQVVFTAVVTRRLSDQVIAVDGVMLNTEPARETLVLIDPVAEVDPDLLDEGTLVGVKGEVMQVTDRELAQIDRSVYAENGEYLEGFRAAWGVYASGVTPAQAADEE